jgi:ABC-type antimicrobial peptide transport system ATPase subunit
VHVDIDFAFFRPMDELFDAMLENTRKDEIVTQYPVREWPADIEAYITRDYQQLVPGDKRSLFQAGFMIVKPSQQVFDELVQVILEGNFVEGWKNTSGWAALVMLGRLGPRLCKG